MSNTDGEALNAAHNPAARIWFQNGQMCQLFYGYGGQRRIEEKYGDLNNFFKLLSPEGEIPESLRTGHKYVQVTQQARDEAYPEFDDAETGKTITSEQQCKLDDFSVRVVEAGLKALTGKTTDELLEAYAKAGKKTQSNTMPSFTAIVDAIVFGGWRSGLTVAAVEDPDSGLNSADVQEHMKAVEAALVASFPTQMEESSPAPSHQQGTPSATGENNVRSIGSEPENAPPTGLQSGESPTTPPPSSLGVPTNSFGR